MDEELLKKILGAAGVKNITPEILKSVSQVAQSDPTTSPKPAATSQSNVDAIKEGLAKASVVDPYLAQEQKRAPIEENIARRFADSDAGYGLTISSKSWDRDMRKLQDTHNTEMAKIRQEEYGRAGMEDPRAKEFAPYLENARQKDIESGKISGLDAYKERNQAAQAEAARRDGIRNSNSLDISKNLNTGAWKIKEDGSVSPVESPFRDASGKVEGPAELKGRLMKEKGMNVNDATIAAGQRYRDMFDLPNAKSEGFGMRGGQRDAVMNTPKGLREDGTSPRVDVINQLRAARAENLKTLTEQRLADPNRKPVGIITEISSNDGTVLAKRGEGESVVTRGGTQGAVGGLEDKPGTLTLTQAGENAIRDRLTVNKTEGGGTVVTGRYGTAMSGPKSTTDQLKESGAVAKNFQLTPEQRTGQAPLPKEYAEGQNKLLAEAGQAAKSQGAVVGDAKTLLDRMAPGTAQAIDQKSDKIAEGLKQPQGNKLGAASPGLKTGQDNAAPQALVNKDDEVKRRLARR